ncbi:MAG: DNA methyltransferase [Chloroflexota bacterium]|nr:DNA methyltransferase [Chloroflexota bacterium]
MGSYLAWMSPRLIEMRRVLTQRGTLYLHCDPTTSHYLKTLADAIFGSSCYRNELVWAYPASPSASKRNFPSKHDVILRYSVSGDWVFNADAVRVPYAESSLERVRYAANASTVMAGRSIELQEGGKLPPSVWSDIQQTYRYRAENTRYPTQKPTLLYERMIAASSNAGDVVLDPFAGCATTCVAAQRLGRRWIGIDVESEAVRLCRMRLVNELGFDGRTEELTEPPDRDDDRQLELIPRNQRLRLELWQRMQTEAEAETPPCEGCGRAPGMDYMEVDHIIPRSRGGEHTWDNVQLLCGPCNRSKGNKTMAQWRRDRASTGSR